MNLTPRAANQLYALDSGDAARILDHLHDRPYGPGAALVEIGTAGGTVRCFVARHKDGSLVLLALSLVNQEGSR